jgi:hypothetical protein
MFNCKICRPIFEHEIHPPWQLRLWSFAALESEGLAVPKRTYREVLQQVGLGLPVVSVVPHSWPSLCRALYGMVTVDPFLVMVMVIIIVG